MKNSQHNLKQSARRLKPGHNCLFQQDNELKHTSKLVMKWIKQAKVSLKTQSHLNPIENAWTVLKSRICARKHKLN